MTSIASPSQIIGKYLLSEHDEKADTFLLSSITKLCIFNTLYFHIFCDPKRCFWQSETHISLKCMFRSAR